ncbi:MAG: hypothetical protein GOV00_03935 [Candidatus Altiarchaeota archaeon]|nr:hypothetical protein [Candidatus Altiarchaeota archaeon]
MKRLWCIMLVLSVVFAWPFGWNRGANITIKNFGEITTNYTTSLIISLNQTFCPDWEGFLENGTVWVEDCEKGKVWITFGNLLNGTNEFSVYFRVNRSGTNSKNVFEFYDAFDNEYELSCNDPKGGCSHAGWLLNASGTASVNVSDGKLELMCKNVFCWYTSKIDIERAFVVEVSSSVNQSANFGSGDFDLTYSIGGEKSSRFLPEEYYFNFLADSNTNMSFLKNELGSTSILETKKVGVFDFVKLTSVTTFWDNKIVIQTKGTYNESLVVYDSTYQNFSRIGFGSYDGKQTIDYIRVWKTANATVEVGILESVNSTHLVEMAWKTPVAWWINGSGCFDNSWVHQVRTMTFENLSVPVESVANESFSNGTVCWTSTGEWSNVSGVNQSCRWYNASEAWTGDFWFLSDLSSPSTGHVEGWINNTVNWTRFVDYGVESEGRWWVNYSGKLTSFLVCVADGQEKFYVLLLPPPKDEIPSGGGGGGGGGWISSVGSTGEQNESILNEDTTINESVDYNLVNVSGIESFEIIGSIWVNDNTIYVEGVGSITLERGFSMVNEAGRRYNGSVPVETGEYRLEREILARGNLVDQVEVEVENKSVGKGVAPVSLNMQFMVVVIFLFLILLAPI